MKRLPSITSEVTNWVFTTAGEKAARNCAAGYSPGLYALLRPSYLPPVRIRLFDILVDMRLEAFQGVRIAPDVELSLVNSKSFSSVGGRDHSVSYRVRTKATILRNILCGIFVKIGFICCRGE